MLRYVSVCVAICSLAGVALADTGMLPNGGAITFERLKIVEAEGESPTEPSSPDALRYQLNLPHCQCAKAGAGFQTSLFYELELSATTATSPPGEVWVGTECDNDEVRDMKCRQLVDQAIDDIDTLAVDPRTIEIPLFDVINGFENTAACQEREGPGFAWVLVDADGDNEYDYTTNKSVGTEVFTDVTGVDTQPPPLVESADANSGENSLIVSWDIPEGRSSDLFAYQAFCIDDTGSAIYEDAPDPLYQTTNTVCGIPQEFELTVIDLPTNAEETDITEVPEAFRTLDPAYLCATQESGTATSISIPGLENGRKYTIAVAAIDYYGNVTGMYFDRTVTPKSVTDLWEDINDNGGKVEGGFCSTGDSTGFAVLGCVIALVALRRRRGVLLALVGVIGIGTSTARADDFVPYWEDPEADAALLEEDVVTWHAGIRLGPYIPDVDAGLMTNSSGQGPYHAMFGDYFDDGKRVAKHVWQVLPMLDVDRILWRGFGQLGVGGSLGYMQKSALAYTEDSSPADGVARERAPGSTIKFRLIPTAATVTYRFTYLDDEWGIPIVPYLRGGLSYYIWWMKAPSGNTSRICTDGTASATCEGNKAYGGTLGYQGSIGLAIRAERIDSDAARSMQNSGIRHAGFYGELSLAKVDGFGSETKLSVGDATWFAGVNFEF
jgi:hypothetical protein